MLARRGAEGCASGGGMDAGAQPVQGREGHVWIA